MVLKSGSLHVVGGIGSASGGLGPFVRGICDALIAQGQTVGVVTGGSSGEEPGFSDSRVAVTTVPRQSRRRFIHWDGFKTVLRERIQSMAPDVIHAHSLWTTCIHAASVSARRSGIPIVISTHGCLEPWAIGYRAWKKKLALALYQRRDLNRAAGFHATAVQEAMQLREFGLWQPIAVIPVGVCLPAPFQKEPHLGRPRTALFLSRIHPKKGLIKLLDVWAELKPDSWELVLAGNDDQNHLKDVLAGIAERGLEKNVRYVGPAFGDEKDRLLKRADLFVLPTFSENFGIVVAEALSYGVPVITTDGTPWADLRDHDCGWYVGKERESLAAALKEALAAPDDDLREKGQRGRILIEEKYQWPAIAREMALFYRWISGRGDRPSCVLK
ncbi:MAG: glycosyltransferase [Pseudomonadota bacterium]